MTFKNVSTVLLFT